MKSKGFDSVIKSMKDVERFTASLNGELDNISFDPNDPASIDQAIESANTIIDNIANRYPRNDFVASAAHSFKEQIRAQIIEKAQNSRLESGE